MEELVGADIPPKLHCIGLSSGVDRQNVEWRKKKEFY